MDVVTGRELVNLAARRAGPCVSIYMPTHRAGIDAQQNPIRLKNLLREAEERLVAEGTRTSEARRLLEPARGLLADEETWTHQSDGLAVLVGPESLHTFCVPRSFDESLTVGPRFRIRPLLPLVDAGDDRYFLLTLSQNRVRLLRGSRYELKPLDVPGLPGKLSEALGYDRPQETAQAHAAGQRAQVGSRKQAAVFHGQGGAPDAAGEEQVQYCRLIERAVQETLQRERAPLVLAGTNGMLATYRQLNNYKVLLDDVVTGNADRAADHELHARSWPLIEARLAAAASGAAARFRQLAGSDKTSSDISEIVVAAHGGRIDTLLIDQAAEKWGRFDGSTGRVEVYDKTQPGDEDLVELAAVETLRQRGTLYALAAEDAPSGAPAAAIFRY